MMAASDGKGDLDSISADLWLMDGDGLHVMNMFSLSVFSRVFIRKEKITIKAAYDCHFHFLKTFSVGKWEG